MGDHWGEEAVEREGTGRDTEGSLWCVGGSLAKTRYVVLGPRYAREVVRVLTVVDLLIIGFGAHTMPLSPATRKVAADLGLKVDLMDTRNAQSAFNMLATERGVENVAGALIPLGWEEGVGCVE